MGKKLLCTFLAALLLGAAVGCNGGSQPSVNPGTPGSSASGQLSSAAEPEKRGKITVSVYDRGNVPAAEGTIENNRWTKWINENGPVDVEFIAIPRTKPDEKLNVLFASRSAPDLIFEYAPTIKGPLYQQKQLMPLDDLIEQHSTNYKQRLEEYPSLAKAGQMDDGQIYQFGKVNLMTPIRGIVIRQDWLDTLGLATPVTLEDFFNVAKAFTERDPDGNGQADTRGFALAYRANETFNQLIPSGYRERDGQMIFTWDSQQLRLQFKKDLYDNGIVDKEFLTDTNGARAMQDFVNGKLGILPWQYNWRTFLRGEYKTLKENVPDAEISFVAYPVTEYGQFLPTFENPIQMTAVVNAACKDPVSVMRYVDFTCSEEFALALRYGIEGEHYTLENGVVVPELEKTKNEVSWAGDFGMLIDYPDYAPYESKTAGFDISDPFEAECYELYKKALGTYMNPNLPYSDFTHSEHMPIMPKEIATINANIKLDEFFDKSTVSGADYTVEQAIADAKAAWEKGEGEKVLAWWQDWYANHRHEALLWDELSKIMEEANYLNSLP